jgi:hypothetical protein
VPEGRGSGPAVDGAGQSPVSRARFLPGPVAGSPCCCRPCAWPSSFSTVICTCGCPAPDPCRCMCPGTAMGPTGMRGGWKIATEGEPMFTMGRRPPSLGTSLRRPTPKSRDDNTCRQSQQDQ